MIRGIPGVVGEFSGDSRLPGQNFIIRKSSIVASRGALLFQAALAFLLCGAIGQVRASIVSWGDNTYGQSPSITPAGTVGATAVAAGYWHDLAITPQAGIVAWGLDDYGQVDVPALPTNAIAVAGGHDHSLALFSDGTMAAWGDDSLGQTDIPTGLPGATAISAGAFHNAALLSDGTVTCWGYNFYGQTNVPAGLSNVVAIACGNSFTLALKNDGTITGWGDDFYGQIDVPPDLTNVTAIAAGGFHGVALLADGTVRCWGYDVDGQADVPPTATNITSIAAGYLHTLALRGDNVVLQWGDTSLGQTNPPAAFPGQVLALTAGYAHSAALVDDHPVIISQPQDVSTNSGKTVRFTLTAKGGLPLTARWFRVTGTNNFLTSTTVQNNPTSLATFTYAVANVISNTTYFAVLSNSVGAVTSRLATVTILIPPSIISQPRSVATNAGATVFFSVTATGSEPLFYQWTRNGSNTVWATNSSFEMDYVTTNQAGSYKVTVSNAAGSITSATAVLTLDGSATIIDEPQSVSVAEGDDATFSVGAVGDPPPSYQWYFNRTNLIADATDPDLTITNAQWSDGGAYTVVVTNIYNAVTSTVATLGILAPPVIVSQPPDIATNSGRTVKFVLTAYGTAPLNTTWWRITGTNNLLSGNTSVTNATNLATFSLSVANVSSNVSYFAIVSNVFGTTTSRVAGITLLIPPSITNQPQSVATNPGATVFFSVGAAGSPPLFYQWSLSNTSLPGETNSTLELDNVSSNQAGNYKVTVSNPVGSTNSQVATLTVDGSAVILDQPQSLAVAEGDDAGFSVTAAGDPAPSYQWYFNRTNLLQDATNADLTVSNAQWSDGGNYTVVVTNIYNAVTSSVAALTILAPPMIVGQPQDASTNSGRTVRFVITTTGTEPMNATWWRVTATNNLLSGNTTVSNSTNLATFSFSVANVTSNTAYFAIVSNAFGTMTSRVANITVLLPPSIIVQPVGVATNPGATVFLNVTATGSATLNYQWNFDGASLPGATNSTLELDGITTNQAGTYQVRITNSVGSTNSQIVRLAVGYQSLTPAQLYFLSHSVANGDALMIALQAGRNYRVQSSSNLQDWLDVANFLSDSTLVPFTNALATNSTQLFYRVVSP